MCLMRELSRGMLSLKSILLSSFKILKSVKMQLLRSDTHLSTHLGLWIMSMQHLQMSCRCRVSIQSFTIQPQLCSSAVCGATELCKPMDKPGNECSDLWELLGSHPSLGRLLQFSAHPHKSESFSSYSGRMCHFPVQHGHAKPTAAALICQGIRN